MAQESYDNRDTIFAEEAFVVEVQGFLHEIMEEKGISRADLARAMNVSRARITQIFSDECTNFTIRLLARAMYALEEQPSFDRVHKRQKDVTNLSSLFAKRELRTEDWVELQPIDESGARSCANDNIFGGLKEAQRSKASYRMAA